MGLAEDIRASIYEEHLDEASFLYEQRKRYLEDPEVTLTDVAELEARLEAHLDGLALGGTQAETLCRAKVAGDDAGLQHAALRVFCRRTARDALLEALAFIQQGEPMSFAAAGDALCAELPQAFTAVAREELARCDAKLLEPWSRAIGYHRLPLATELIAAAERVVEAPAACAWALGELRDKSAEAFLLGQLWRGGPDVACAAAIALLKCGSTVGLGEIEVLASQASPWFAVPLVLSGRGRFSLLADLERQAPDSYREDALLALGLAGDMRAIPQLLERLGDEKLGKPAAAALQLLTGAALMETAAKPEPKDEALDDDLIEPDEAPEPDEPPVRPTTERRLCLDAARWQEWLQPRDEELAAHERLRMGTAASAASTAAALDGTTLPLKLRAWLGDELQIRFGAEAHYHPDQPVARQRTVLAALAQAPARPRG